jgi:type III restriction enzyme
MITAAIENLIDGDSDHPPSPDTTILWVTDQPELNEQTRRKMLSASSTLGPSNFVAIDASFDRETFTPGVIHFINIQKLGREKDLVAHGDERTFTIWETITNTIASRKNFLVIIDEAHRGMSENARARNEAVTIVQKFIKGSAGEIPPVPIVVGISATPERFNKLIEGTSRTARSIVIEPEDVRASGLLKEIITLFHPTQNQPSDMTMLRAAARSWRQYAKVWKKYCAEQGEQSFDPVLVVQVQDGTAGQLSKTDIAEAIGVISEEVGTLPASAFAHAFQESTSITVAPHELRYVSPPDVQLDPELAVIFFKTSLNTGWDCPRAEVMMSFRSALDATLIAQLVGRMVRTPLARRIESSEFLNTVALYLPHYDEQGLNNVIARLTTPDADIMPPVSIEKGEDLLTLARSPNIEDVFLALSALPSYTIPRSRKTSQVHRLMRLSRLLTHDQIDENAIEKAKARLLEILREEYGNVARSRQFRATVEEKAKMEMRQVNWRVGTDDAQEGENIVLNIAAENIDDLFDGVGRKLGEGLHKTWWKSRVEDDNADRQRAKLELFALCADPAIFAKMEKAAQQLLQKWLKTHARAIAKLTEAPRQAYDDVRRLAAEPELLALNFPETVEAKKATTVWDRHAYSDNRGKYPALLNTWETQVLTEELGREDVIAWLRNQDRKAWSLCIPYLDAGECKPLYPDFLVLRDTRDGIVVDLLDPHSIDLADAPSKAAGLAQYAAKHAHEYGRIELIIVDGNQLKRLDLADETIRNRVKGVTTHEHLRQLFELF